MPKEFLCKKREAIHLVLWADYVFGFGYREAGTSQVIVSTGDISVTHYQAVGPFPPNST